VKLEFIGLVSQTPMPDVRQTPDPNFVLHLQVQPLLSANTWKTPRQDEKETTTGYQKRSLNHSQNNSEYWKIPLQESERRSGSSSEYIVRLCMSIIARFRVNYEIFATSKRQTLTGPYDLSPLRFGRACEAFQTYS